jgi:hypothetical protein
MRKSTFNDGFGQIDPLTVGISLWVGCILMIFSAPETFSISTSWLSARSNKTKRNLRLRAPWRLCQDGAEWVRWV